ncbi:MAG: hypothetical protein KDA79_09280 [Planctomycetaceae bacterium]|nr:hypothetical protein [Planctomycetaceae bacterium]
MKRVVYTVYFELSEEEIARDTEYYRGDDPSVSKSRRTQIEFRRHYDRLRAGLASYAVLCGADFFLLGDDARFRQFCRRMPAMSTYQLINLYKIFLLEHFAETYDEILYCDFDIVPNTFQSIFEEFDFSRGVCLYPQKPMRADQPFKSERSPATKHEAVGRMLASNGIRRPHEVPNTGIIGIAQSDVDRISFFAADFPDLLAEITRLGFVVNNEALLSYRLCANRIVTQPLCDSWHHIYNSGDAGGLNEQAHMIHVICKRFDDVWDARALRCPSD